MLQRIILAIFLLGALLTGLQMLPSRATATAECPQIIVSGSQDEGPMAHFNADVVPGTYDVTYNWAVSDGAIESGQGTSTIDVAGMEGNLVTATVDIGGMPAECNSAASSTVEIL
ncbi:MAG: hypothetical protein ABI668_14210 [Sphingorhabdus sp.]